VTWTKKLDPVTDTIFATHGEQFGEGVLHIATSENLGGAKILPGNVLSGLEHEVGVELPPTEFAARSGQTISAATARSILGDMGYQLPSSIPSVADVSAALAEATPMSEAEIAEFVALAAGE
jgi:hypothetical protein